MEVIDDFEKLCEVYDLVESVKSKITEIVNLFYANEYAKCASLITNTEPLINDHFEDIHFFVRLNNYFLLCGDCYANLGNEQKAFEYYQRYHFANYRIRGSYSGECVKLLSFRKVSVYALNDLINSEITLADPTLMNDPFDSIALLWSDPNNLNKLSCGIRKTHEYFSASFKSFRIRCFSKNKIYNRQNNLMWAHYADEHKGFCIEYCLMPETHGNFNFSNLSFSLLQNVKYDIDNDDVLHNKTLNTSIAFASKEKVWKYEGEVRLISFNPNYESKFISIGLGKSYISSIYFGYRCPDNHIKLIRNILGERVRYYQMRQAQGKLYTLHPIILK